MIFSLRNQFSEKNTVNHMKIFTVNDLINTAYIFLKKKIIYVIFFIRRPTAIQMTGPIEVQQMQVTIMQLLLTL